MELVVDRVRSGLVRVDRRPELNQAVVVSATALRTWPVSSRKRGRLVEEEQLGVAARSHQPRPASPAELKLASDPSPGRVRAADGRVLVVEAAAVAIHEPALGRGDQIAKWGNPVLQGQRQAASPASR